ncbi:MAG: DegV family protein [Aggregatilineales bacterium]
MSNIAIVADSTCDLPAEVVKARQIGIVPLHILFGTRSYRDGIDIDNTTFYNRLQREAALPTTSQPTPAEFAEVYRQVREQQNADGLVCVTVSAKLSGTYNSADAARTQVDFPVRVIDSRTVSMGLGFAVLAAADARDQGASLDEISEAARAVGERVELFFTVNTLEFLYRGGRISNAQRMIGSALNIKPILAVRDGQALAIENVRTRKRALARLAELAGCVDAEPGKLHLAVMDGEAPAEADALAAELQTTLKPVSLTRASLSATLGVHTGPGIVGVGVLPS